MRDLMEGDTPEQAKHRKIFDKWQKGHWKDSQDGLALTTEDALCLKQAFEFFHGTRSRIEPATISLSYGLISMDYQGYHVWSPGYGG
jgi:hypothetical protein